MKPLLATTALLSSLASPSFAADPIFCALWGREMARIEACSGLKFEMMLEGNGFLFIGTQDVDMATALPKVIQDRAESHSRSCRFLVEVSEIPLPRVACLSTAAWSVAAAQGSLGRMGTVPALEGTPEVGMSGFPRGSADWLAWCRAEYRSWDEETQTVVRRGNPERVPCPG